MIKFNDKLNKDIYSTTETKTNKVWIDGKPIYRKVYTGNAVKSNRVVLETTTAIDTFVDGYGWATSAYDWIWAIPNSGDFQIQARYNTSEHTVQLYFGNNFSTSNTFVFTLEYTKTTD